MNSGMPFAFGFSKGSPLRSEVNVALLTLVDRHEFLSMLTTYGFKEDFEEQPQLPEEKKKLTALLCPLFIFLSFVIVQPALAVRPFVTDDARVVGEHMGQVETSVRYTSDSFSNLNLVALGPTERSEVTVGFVDGFPLDVDSNRSFSVTGPLMQFKYLLLEAKPNSYPGLAVATGASPPWGRGDFRPEQWNGFFYAAMTESLFDRERVLIHANLGISTSSDITVGTWGLGAQIRMIGGLHAVLEVFCNDPYAGKIGGAYQAGFRYIVSDSIQIDFTGGSGIFGSDRINTFVGMGLRIVSDKLW